jgi:hypothetical protein
MAALSGDEYCRRILQFFDKDKNIDAAADNTDTDTIGERRPIIWN